MRPVHVDLRSGRTVLTVEVKSPASMMATATLPLTSALEQYENGWEVTEKRDLPTVIQANWLGSNCSPSWPAGRRVSTVVLL